MMGTLITKMTMIIRVTILRKKRDKDEDNMVVDGLVNDLFDEFYRRIVLVFVIIVSPIVIFIKTSP